MTHNEVAKKGDELIEKFRKHSFPSNNEEDTIQCAIIAVEEIIDAIPEDQYGTIYYWNEVLNYLKTK